jgi:uncharacterized protein (DUF4415 family)
MKLASSLKPPRATSAKAVDRDNPRWLEEMLEPPIVRKVRGPQKAPTKVLASIRLDPEVLACFGPQGAGYQNRIHQMLKAFVASRPTWRSTGRAAKASRAG